MRISPGPAATTCKQQRYLQQQPLQTAIWPIYTHLLYQGW